MARKIFEKAGMIPGLQPLAPAAPGAAASDQAPKPKTAPGTMMGFLTAQSDAVQEAETLRSRVRALEQQAPLRRIDAARIRRSRWANRHEQSFATADFAALKAEIAAAGGNVQPVKVRPVAVLNGSTAPDGEAFELIFGHRRHRACAELGLPVLAVVEEASDLSLFEQMERENRGRQNLSAWEQGVMYRKALDEGLFGSLRRLAESLGVDVSMVSKSVALARLPEAVIGAFSSPLDIQFRWAAPLTEAMQKDPEGTLARARELGSVRGTLGAPAVLARLLGTAPGSGPVAPPTPASPVTKPLSLSRAGQLLARLACDEQGRVTIHFEAGVLPPQRHRALMKALEDFLRE